MGNKVPLTINGKDVEAMSGQTILEVARQQGIYIPTLCHYFQNDECRRLPRLRRGSGKGALPGRLLLHACQSRHGDSHRHQKGQRRPKNDRRAPLGRPAITIA